MDTPFYNETIKWKKKQNRQKETSADQMDTPFYNETKTTILQYGRVPLTISALLQPNSQYTFISVYSLWDICLWNTNAPPWEKSSRSKY